MKIAHKGYNLQTAFNNLLKFAEANNIGVKLTTQKTFGKSKVRVNVRGVVLQRDITINKSLILEQKIITLAHELGHQLLHQNDSAALCDNKHKNQKELECILIELGVCEKLGIDNEFSFKQMEAHNYQDFDYQKTIKKIKPVMKKITGSLGGNND